MGQRYNVIKKANALGRLCKLLKPSLRDNNAEDSLPNWEDYILNHEKETQSPLPVDVQIAAMMHDMKGAPQNHLRLKALNLKMYQDVKQVIMNYFRSRQIFQGSTSSAIAPIKVDAGWGCGNGKRGKGKGKGDKGKGKCKNKGKDRGQGIDKLFPNVRTGASKAGAQDIELHSVRCLRHRRFPHHASLRVVKIIGALRHGASHGMTHRGDITGGGGAQTIRQCPPCLMSSSLVCGVTTPISSFSQPCQQGY